MQTVNCDFNKRKLYHLFNSTKLSLHMSLITLTGFFKAQGFPALLWKLQEEIQWQWPCADGHKALLCTALTAGGPASLAILHLWMTQTFKSSFKFSQFCTRTNSLCLSKHQTPGFSSSVQFYLYRIQKSQYNRVQDFVLLELWSVYCSWSVGII